MEYTYTKDFLRKEWLPHAWGCKVEETTDRIFLRQLQIKFEVPDDFNPIPHQVASLEREKAKALEEYQERVAEINDRLSKLLSITNEVSE
jgi:hypothetical protein